MKQHTTFEIAAAVFAALSVAPAATPALAQERQGETLSFPRSYFDRFSPVTALDMVRQMPGFRLSEDADRRGLAAASGNVLIDGERPAGKGTSLADALERISADRVARIELIRGSAAEADLGGHAMLVNVILTKTSKPDAPWRIALIAGAGELDWAGEAVHRGGLGKWDYSATISRGAAIDSGAGEVVVHRFGGPGEEWSETELERTSAWSLTGGLNGALGGLPLNLSLRRAWQDTDGEELTERRRSDGSGLDVVRTLSVSSDRWNFGADLSLPPLGGFEPKLLAVWNRRGAEAEEVQEVRALDGSSGLERSVEEVKEGEAILRAEATSSSSSGRRYTLGAEIAHTFVDSNLSYSENEGAGSALIPGADTKVEELRVEAGGSAALPLSDRLRSVWTAAAEASVLRQSGDFERERSFLFLKPALVLTYKLSEGTELKFNVERQVGQLDFSDFAASVSLDDDRVNFGNPELVPSRTWLIETGYLRQFSARSRLELKLSREWIGDLIEFVPLEGGGEAIGNIGDGEVLGLAFEGAAPLGGLGLGGARIEASGRVKWTRVRDPVTGEMRRFGNERFGVIEIAYHQQLGKSWNWGWVLDVRSAEAQYRIDEFELSSRGARFDLFVEHAIGNGIKARIDLFNLTDHRQRQRRSIYQISRAEGDPAIELDRVRRFGRFVQFAISGTF